MTVFRSYSKMQIAKIFGVSRSTVYDWEGNGLPVRQHGRDGRPAKLDFEAVLEWYLTHEDIKGVSEEGLAIIEQAIRERKTKYYG